MKATILLIEDNEQNRYLATFLLEKAGYAVMAAAAGRLGVEAAGRTLPALTLLDIHLPTMDGYAVAMEPRKNPALDHIPIVAVTSYAMAGDQEKTLAADCNGYLEKPINPETFVAEISRFVKSPELKGTP